MDTRGLHAWVLLPTLTLGARTQFIYLEACLNLFCVVAMRCARNDMDIRQRLVRLLRATGQDKEALRVRLTALLFSKHAESSRRSVYGQMTKIAEVGGHFLKILHPQSTFVLVDLF